MDLGSVGEAPTKEEEEEANAFVFDPNKEHYFAILIPVDKGNGVEAKAQASDFNNAFFESRNLRVTSNLLSRTHQIVLVKSFSNLSKAMDYHTVFTGNREMLIDLNSSGLDMFVISSVNYIELFKNKDLDEYINFFNTHYLSEKHKKEP